MSAADELELRARVLELVDELGVLGRPREEMLADPLRALNALQRAKYSLGITNPAAYATARFRQRAPAPAAPELELELDDEPPTLSALEYAWSRPPSAPVSALLTLMAAAVGRHGFAKVQASFRYRDHYDDAGELVDRLDDA